MLIEAPKNIEEPVPVAPQEKIELETPIELTNTPAPAIKKPCGCKNKKKHMLFAALFIAGILVGKNI